MNFQDYPELFQVMIKGTKKGQVTANYTTVQTYCLYDEENMGYSGLESTAPLYLHLGR